LEKDIPREGLRVLLEAEGYDNEKYNLSINKKDVNLKYFFNQQKCDIY
jgi:hypothetical protein